MTGSITSFPRLNVTCTPSMWISGMRMMGQASLQLEGIPMKRPVKRRRLRTVLEHIIMTPAVVTKYARKTGVDLGRSNSWRNAVAQLWERFHKAAWEIIFFMRHCAVCGISRMPLLRNAVFLKNQGEIQPTYTV